MTLEQFPLLALFIVAMVGSPGPANTLLMASGATFGFRATMPFLIGTLAGFTAVGLAVGLGLAALLQESQVLTRILAGTGLAYVLYLAWRIATAEPHVVAPAKRFGFLEGLAVHPVNPKAWLMLIAAVAQFVDPTGQKLSQVGLLVAAFIVIGGPLNAAWVFGGQMMTARLSRPETLRAVNRGLAALLAIVVLAMAAPYLPQTETREALDLRYIPLSVETPAPDSAEGAADI